MGLMCANPACTRGDTPMWRKGWTRPNETEPVSLCNACGILFKRGWFCVHCEEVYRKLEGADDDAAGPAGPWIGCDFCERWSHVSCELAHAPDALASTFPAATATADISLPAAAAEQPPRQEDNAETVVKMKPPAPSIPDPRVSLFNADGAAMSSTPYRCPECRGKPDDTYVPPPRALASHASQTSLAAGAHVLDGRVVHNRPFLRAGDKRTTGGGGGGGQGGRAAAARPNADGAAPKGKRSRGGSRKPAVKFEPGVERATVTARAPKRRRTRPAKFTPNGGEGRAAGGKSYALGKRKLLPPPSSPIAPPTMPKMLDDVPGESPLLNASLFNDGGEPSPAVVYAGRPINDLSSHDAVAANSWAAQAASIAAAAERRRGSRVGVDAGGMGTPSGLSLLRRYSTDEVRHESENAVYSPGSIFTLENLAGGAGYRTSSRTSPPYNAARAFIARNGGTCGTSPTASTAPGEFGSSSALDTLGRIPASGHRRADGMHCPPVSSHSRALLPARMPQPVTPALPVPPRDPIALGGTGAIWNLGGKLDTLRSETREEDDLMEPDSPLEGFHSLVVERFEDLRESARLLAAYAASEGLVLNLTRGTSPGDGYGSGGSGSRGSGSGPGSASGYDFGSPDESAALTTMAHLSLASSATRELVRRTGAAVPVGALLRGSKSRAVREAAARLAASPAWRDAVAREIASFELALTPVDTPVDDAVDGVVVGGGEGYALAPSSAAADPFFVAGVEAMRPVGTNSVAGVIREEVLPVEVDEEALVRTGSAGALEPKPAGSAGIKGHELRNSVM